VLGHGVDEGRAEGEHLRAGVLGGVEPAGDQALLVDQTGDGPVGAVRAAMA
jgi:hypothetical protein